MVQGFDSAYCGQVEVRIIVLPGDNDQPRRVAERGTQKNNQARGPRQGGFYFNEQFLLYGKTQWMPWPRRITFTVMPLCKGVSSDMNVGGHAPTYSACFVTKKIVALAEKNVHSVSLHSWPHVKGLELEGASIPLFFDLFHLIII